MDILDIFLSIVYLAIILAIGSAYRNKKYAGTPLYGIFIPALTVKLLGALAFGLIYTYYYRGGDTFWFFQGIKVMHDTFFQDPIAFFKILTLKALEYTPDTARYTSQIWWFRDANSMVVIKIGGILSLFTFKSYFATSLLFATLSFSGIWKMFTVFYEYMPDLVKNFRIAFFFVPSVFFWGSGILKDTVMLASIGWVFYCFYQLFFKKNYQLKYVLALLLFTLIMIKLRAFVFYTLAPTLMISLFFKYSGSISNVVARSLIAPVLLVIMIGVTAVFINFSSSIGSRYALGSLEKRAYDTQWWHTKVQQLEGDQGSAYSLGAPSGSLPSLLAKFPLAIIVTFFRPFLWEIHGVTMLFAAVESLVILFLTLKILLSTNPTAFFKYTLSDPLVAFALIFAIVYGFGVGVTSYNFGALVRYKIPAIPLYISALYMIQYYAKNPKKEEVLEETE